MGNYKIKLSGIYIIENSITKKYYIGKSLSILERWQGHYTLLKQNNHHSPELQEEFNQYGVQVFIFRILEYVSKTDFKSSYNVKGKVLEYQFNRLLLQKERDWMRLYSINQCLNKDKKYFS